MKFAIMLLLAGTFCAGGALRAGEAQRKRSLVGAIRWDAWNGDKGFDAQPRTPEETGTRRITAGMAVERSLGPKHWHYRLPFYAKVVGENKVEVRGNTQQVMDKEIAYAAAAGLDYWAFVTYAPESPMTDGLKLYLSSRNKARVKFCLLLHQVMKKAPDAEAARFVALMKDPQYVTVLGGRPLVYAFHCRAEKAFFEKLLRAASAAGLKRPYLVNMGNCTAGVSFDAMSSYTGRGGQAEWERERKRGRKVVPAVSGGWDRRPRDQNPVPWDRNQKPRQVRGGRLRSAEKAHADIATGVKRALVWNRRHPAAGEAGAVIIYAWNEFDEGGWICPTISEGTGRLDAIRKVLEEEERVLGAAGRSGASGTSN
jgi:hypothetical protein